MDKCVIFGTGNIAQKAYGSLSKVFDIVEFCDNDQSKHGEVLFGKSIKGPEDIDKTNKVIICSSYYYDIYNQLNRMGITDVYQYDETVGILVELSDDDFLRQSSKLSNYHYHKKYDNKMHILFVQINPYTRAHKLAEALNKKGIDVSFAHLGEWSNMFDGYKKYYKNRTRFFSISDMIDYVNNSSYDLVHSFNAPDYLSLIMQTTNKMVVHDNADFESLNRDVNLGIYTMEYIANNKSDAAVYVSEACRNMAIERYHVNPNRAVVVENMPSDEATKFKKMPKISSKDGKIHAVYFGGVVDNPGHSRFFEDLWKRIANEGIHIHFYSQSEEDYCYRLDQIDELIHFEGKVQANDLLGVISQYDCGLVLYQDIPRLKYAMDITIANKIYEYAAAGLPQAVGDFSSYLQVVEKYGLGKRFYWNQDIKKQFEEICKIEVDKNVLKNNRLMMEYEIDKLIDLYNVLLNNVD